MRFRRDLNKTHYDKKEVDKGGKGVSISITPDKGGCQGGGKKMPFTPREEKAGNEPNGHG